MNRNAARSAGLAIALLIFAGSFWVQRRFFSATPAQRIESLFRRGAAAAQDESILGLDGIFARDYRDASGAERTMVLAQVKRFFDESENLKVEIAQVIHDDPDLAEDATEARAIVVVKTTGTIAATGDKFGGIGGTGSDAFVVDLRKERGAWLVARTRRLSAQSPAALLREANGI